MLFVEVLGEKKRIVDGGRKVFNNRRMVESHCNRSGHGGDPKRIIFVCIRGSLKNIIKYLYGERILAKVNNFNEAKKLSNLAFIKRCRDNNIIPKFL